MHCAPLVSQDEQIGLALLHLIFRTRHVLHAARALFRGYECVARLELNSGFFRSDGIVRLQIKPCTQSLLAGAAVNCCGSLFKINATGKAPETWGLPWDVACGQALRICRALPGLGLARHIQDPSYSNFRSPTSQQTIKPYILQGLHSRCG